jgi:hypothetical protein
MEKILCDKIDDIKEATTIAFGKINTIIALQEKANGLVAKCQDETKTNTMDIVVLKTKQKMLTYIGGLIGTLIIGVLTIWFTT